MNERTHTLTNTRPQARTHELESNVKLGSLEVENVTHNVLCYRVPDLLKWSTGNSAHSTTSSDRDVIYHGYHIYGDETDAECLRLRVHRHLMTLFEGEVR